jgi:hypothetical protein
MGGKIGGYVDIKRTLNLTEPNNYKTEYWNTTRIQGGGSNYMSNQAAV